MSEKNAPGFYVTVVPPGQAEGADSWNDYNDLPPPPYEEEIDQNFDEEGNPRPLDWFFNDDN